jgi:hypothetical protein
MQDNDKLLKLANSINSLVDIGEEVFKDGKVDFADVAQIGPLLKEVGDLVDVFKARQELLEEVKDLDASEAVEFIQALLEKK